MLNRKRHIDEIPLTSKRATPEASPLAVLYPLSASPELPIVHDSTLIGRSSQCHIKLSGLDISGRHCHLSLIATDGRDYLNLTDLSTKGTYVNGELLGPQKQRVLQNGDKLSFGQAAHYIIRYRGVEPSFFALYTLGALLGTGHYAQVREAQDRRTGAIHAVKIFHPQVVELTALAKMRQELDLLMSIDHPHVVQLIDNFNEPVNRTLVVKYLVLEKVNGGELFQRVVSKGKLRPDETQAIFRQLLLGLSYLHSKEIIHRDIKPENVLLEVVTRAGSPAVAPWDEGERSVTVKIADFGLAKCIGELNFTQTLCGTPAYVAPEILDHSRRYSKSVDMWSAGVLLYVCLCGFPPFSEELAPPSMRQQILEGRYAFYSPYWDAIADEVLDLISRLLVTDPVQRLTVEEAQNHRWFGQPRSKGFVVFADEPLVAARDAEVSEAKDTTGCIEGSKKDPEASAMAAPSLSLRALQTVKVPPRVAVRAGTEPLTLQARFSVMEGSHSFRNAC